MGLAVELPALLRLSPRFGDEVPVTFDLPTIQRTLRFVTANFRESRSLWSVDAGWLASAMFLGLFLLTPLPPLQSCWTAAVREAPRSIRPLILGAIGIPVVFLARLAGPLFAGELQSHAAPVVLSVLGIAAALTTLAWRDGEELFTGVFTTQLAIAGAGLCSGLLGGQVGGVFWFASSCVAVAGAMTTLNRSGLSGLRFAACLGLWGVPLTGGFVGQWMWLTAMVSGSESAPPQVVAGMLGVLAVSLNGWSLARFLTIQVSRSECQPAVGVAKALQPPVGQSANVSVSLVLALFMAGLAALGVWPDRFLGLIRGAMSASP